MDKSAPISLRLITDLDETLEHHCSLCLFFHEMPDSPCEHRRNLKIPRPPSTTLTDMSVYTAQTSEHWTRAKPSKKPPALRRKISPTEISLRELRAKQSRQSLVKAKRSEEKLQQLYESQILAYLDDTYAEIGIAK